MWVKLQEDWLNREPKKSKQIPVTKYMIAPDVSSTQMNIFVPSAS